MYVTRAQLNDLICLNCKLFWNRADLNTKHPDN